MRTQLSNTQNKSEATIKRENRRGEILADMPKAQGARTELSNSTVTKLDTKEAAAKELGFDHQNANNANKTQIAQNAAIPMFIGVAREKRRKRK